MTTKTFESPDEVRSPAAWLLDRSELVDLLGARPVRCDLVHALVQCDHDDAARQRTSHGPASIHEA